MATTLGKELPFPKTQAEMTKYRSNYTFSGGKWYTKAPPTLTAQDREEFTTRNTTIRPKTEKPSFESIQAGIAGVKSQIPSIQQGISALSATDLTDGAGQVQPVISDTTTAVDANNAILNTTGITSMVDTLLAQRDKEIADIKEQQVEKQSFWTKMLGNKKSSEEILKEKYTAVEESPAYKETQRIKALIEPLNLQIAELSNQETAEIENARTLGMSEGWMTRKETAVHNKYNRLKAPIATMMNAHAANALLYQGEVDEARKYAYAAANAAVYDQEFEYNTIKDFMDRNDDFLNSLKETERFYFTNALALSKDALDTARSDKNSVMSMMLQYPKAGITAQDTLQEASAKASAWSGEQTSEGVWAEGTPTSYKEWQLAGSPGTFEEWKKGETGGIDSKFWTVIDKMKNELQQGESWGNVWNRVKAQFPEVSDTTIDNALGGKWDATAGEKGEGTGWAQRGAYQAFKEAGGISNWGLAY